MAVYKTREEMIEEMVESDVECSLDDHDVIVDMFRYGCKGYADMTDEEIVEEYEALNDCKVELVKNDTRE